MMFSTALKRLRNRHEGMTLPEVLIAIPLEVAVLIIVGTLLVATLVTSSRSTAVSAAVSEQTAIGKGMQQAIQKASFAWIKNNTASQRELVLLSVSGDSYKCSAVAIQGLSSTDATPSSTAHTGVFLKTVSGGLLSASDLGNRQVTSGSGWQEIAGNGTLNTKLASTRMTLKTATPSSEVADHATSVATGVYFIYMVANADPISDFWQLNTVPDDLNTDQLAAVSSKCGIGS